MDRSVAAASHRLPRVSRIVRSDDIQRLLGRGTRKKTSTVDVFFLSSEESWPRLGVIVAKFGNSIVRRNVVKRRIREIGRIDVLPRLRSQGLALDVLIRARRSAYGASFNTLRADLTKAMEDICSGER